MKTSRNLAFLGAVALLLFVGAAVSVQSRAGTSAVAANAPAAAALAASSQYQRSSQPYFAPAADAASLDTSNPLTRRELGVASGR